MKLTPWYPAHIKPVRVGWYHTKNDLNKESPYNWWWDGGLWRFSRNGRVCAFQNRIWRGIAKGE